MVTFRVAVVVAEAGATEQTGARLGLGATAQLKATVPVNPPVGTTLIVEVPAPPGDTV